MMDEPFADPVAPWPVTPLLLSDRLLPLAEQAGRAGMRLMAERILRLATVVLNEPPPLPQ